MAGLLDLLLQQGEYLDPNKVIDRRHTAAGIPNPPRQVPGVPVLPNTEPVYPNPPINPNSSEAIMAEIAARRAARRRAEAGQMLQRQNGVVLPQ
jgi:hypothetical protein